MKLLGNFYFIQIIRFTLNKVHDFFFQFNNQLKQYDPRSSKQLFYLLNILTFRLFCFYYLLFHLYLITIIDLYLSS